MKLTGDSDSQNIKKYYELYFDELYLYAKSITNSTDLAKDAVSDVFLYLFQSGTDLNYIRNVKSYLLTSVKNSSIKILSRNPVYFEYLQDEKEFQMVEEINPQSILIGKELDIVIQEAISQLPPHAKLVFEMIRLQDKSYDEVAFELGISVHTVRNHLVSATKSLREKLHKYNEINGELKISSKFGLVVIPILVFEYIVIIYPFISEYIN